MVYILMIFLRSGVMMVEYSTLNACSKAQERITEVKAVCVEGR